MNVVGFIIKKFVTMHGHMNVKLDVCIVGLRFISVNAVLRMSFVTALIIG